MMGWETANMHLGSADKLRPILADLKKRKRNWLSNAAARMAQAVERDWRKWRRLTRGG